MRTDCEAAIRRQTREDFYSLWSGWKYREKRPAKVWALEVRMIAAGQSPLAKGRDIPYEFDVAPHVPEPLDEADNPDVNIIVLWWARRMFKTEGVSANIIGRTVTDDPGLIYSMWPVEDSADRFGRDVIEPMIEATPELNAVFVDKKSRDSGRTMDYKRYHGGSIYIVNAGSKSKTRGMAAKVIHLPEVDAYPASAGGEGDPIAKALGRAEGFDDAIKIIESTGTFAAKIDDKTGKKIYRSNIERWYDRSDQRKWFCPCRKCGVGQWLKFDQIREVVKKSGNLHFYLCEFCDVDHDEIQWKRMVRAGKWKPTAPFRNGIRGYWINGFNSLLPTSKGYKSKLHQFHAEGHQAMTGKPEEHQVWVNEVKNELWNPESTDEPAPPWKPIYDRREDYGFRIPALGLFLTVFVDVQMNRLEVEWRAHGRRDESWGMDHVVIDGAVMQADVWNKLRVELARKFEHESGAEISLGFGLIDGGKWPDVVHAFLRGLAINPVEGVTGKVRGSKGVGQHGHPIIDTTYRTIGKVLKGHNIGTWAAKDRIYQRLAMKLPSEDDLKNGMPEIPEGWMHYNERFSEDFFQQLTAEAVTVTFDKGEEIRKYINPHQKRNEALDLEVGILAALRLRPRNFDLIEAEILERAAAAKAKDHAPGDGKRQEVIRRPKKGWMTI